MITILASSFMTATRVTPLWETRPEKPGPAFRPAAWLRRLLG